MFWGIVSVLLSIAWADESTATTSDDSNSIDPVEAQKNMIDHSAVLTALQTGDAKGALKESQQVRKSLDCPQRVPLTDDLARLYVHRGYAEQLLGKDEKVQLAWEQAFAIDPNVQMDSRILETLSADEQENLLNHFEQIRRLTEAQGVLDPNIPENLGDAKIFVNGRALDAGQGVKSGEHLAQIVCPTEGLQSQWTTFEEPFDWFGMCLSGVDTTAEQVEEDFFGGGLFGESQEDTSQYFNPTPTCTGGGFTLPSLSLSLPSLEGVDQTTMITMGGGMGLVLAGAGTYYAWVVPAFANIESARARVKTQSITQEEADQVSKAFNMARYTTLGLLATGTALTGYGTILTIQNTSVQAGVTPGWIGLSGQF